VDAGIPCVDVDGDGRGKGCARGPDCDDNDSDAGALIGGAEDFDGDGFTSDVRDLFCTDGTLITHLVPEATTTRDCDDFDGAIHPGAKEVCNGKDDDCNGQVDEGLPRQFFCRDRDGDGHGVPAEGEQAACRAMTGYGDCGGDCDDADPGKYVQYTCGTGWCRRMAAGCSTVCNPGAPAAEVCNAFDDDCDGVVDNGTDLQLCGVPGQKCIAGVCIAADASGGAPGAAGTGGSASRSGAGGGGAMSRPDAAMGAGGGSGDPGGGGAGANEAGGCALARRDGRTNAGVAVALALVLGALARRRRRS